MKNDHDNKKETTSDNLFDVKGKTIKITVFGVTGQKHEFELNEDDKIEKIKTMYCEGNAKLLEVVVLFAKGIKFEDNKTLSDSEIKDGDIIHAGIPNRRNPDNNDS